jgi:hypothetical protein
LKKFFLLFILLQFSFLSFSQDETKPNWIEFNGYVKDMQSFNFVEKLDSNSSSNLIHNRLNFRFYFTHQLTAKVEIRNRFFTGKQIRQIPDFGNYIDTYDGILNLSYLWINQKSVVGHSVIDRIFLQYTLENWDIRVGRQRINWGINNAWSPNDIFNAFNFLDFDYEERPGSDAIRIQRFFKNNSGLDIAFKPGKNNDEHTGAVLYRFNKWRYDFQFLSGIYHNDIVIGSGWAGNIKNAGFKGEWSYFHPQKNWSDSTGTFSVSIMSDKTFKNNWYASLGALYNSHPSNMLMAGSGIFGTNLSPKLLFPFRYNFMASVMKSFSPITSLNVSVIYSPEQNTLILFPSFSWNISSAFDLSFTAQTFFTEFNTEYKNLGNAMFLRGRWSF